MKTYFGDEYDLMNFAKQHLETLGYNVTHVPRRRGRLYKNQGVGKLDHEVTDGAISFYVEYKNPNKKPHQWQIQGSQINTFKELRQRGISHAMVNNMDDLIKVIRRVRGGETVYFYQGLAIGGEE